jgi:heptosyltransferase-2
MPDPARVLVLAPNWLGDAVMALPAVADVRRAYPSARLIVAARGTVADVFRLAPAVDEVVTLTWTRRWWRREGMADAVARLRALGADVAVLLPNSFAAAWLVKQAGVPERWGYRADLRGWLLSRAVRRPRGSRHQGAYYQHLARALGMASGPLEPDLVVPEAATASARRLLVDRGWDGERPTIVLAPGAAYGTAKRWMPAYVARLVSDLVAGPQATCVLVGSRADVATAGLVRARVDAAAAAHVVDLTGETTIDVLAGVLGLARACVSNDSGAMHLAAAVGTPLVAIFGPTREYETAPLTRAGGRAEVLTHPVFCRPCMLRACPIDHRCMKRITPERVRLAMDRLMGADPMIRIDSRPRVGS